MFWLMVCVSISLLAIDVCLRF